MGNKNFERLVIDASIARSAGDSAHPTSSNCRTFLETIMHEKYTIVMTKEIKQEWVKHQSRFATEWKTRMLSKKQLLPIANPGDDRSLWDKLDRYYEDKQRQAVLKDIHLLEAAFDTDRCIFSLDDTMRSLLREALETCPEIGVIIWSNPDREQEEVIVWLREGVPNTHNRYLKTGNPKT